MNENRKNIEVSMPDKLHGCTHMHVNTKRNHEAPNRKEMYITGSISNGITIPD